ncbi:unnamed protein product, partial [Rotaria sp. Silwood1]
IILNKERFEKVNEILLSNRDYYLSTEEVLKICAYEQILNTNDQSHHQQKTSIDISVENIQEQFNKNSLALNIDQQNTDRRSEEVNISRSKPKIITNFY